MDIGGRNDDIVRGGERMIWQKVVRFSHNRSFLLMLMILARFFRVKCSLWRGKRYAQATLLSASAIPFLGSSPKVPPEHSRSEGRVGEDTGNEVVSSRSSSARIRAGGNGSFYLAAEILNS